MKQQRINILTSIFSKRNFVFSFIFILSFGFQLSAQITATRAVSTPKIDLERLIQQQNNDYVITAEHTSSVSGIHHKYIRQAINGIEVYGTESSVHVNARGKTVAIHNNFIGDIQSTLKSSSSDLSAEQAIIAVSKQMNYSITDLDRKENIGGKHRRAIYNGAGISGTDIPVKLMYYYQEGIGTRLVWELSIQELDSSDWWNFRVDANSGAIIDKDNFTLSCQPEDSNHSHDDNSIEKVKNEERTKYIYRS